MQNLTQVGPVKQEPAEEVESVALMDVKEEKIRKRPRCGIPGARSCWTVFVEGKLQGAAVVPMLSLPVTSG